MNPATTRAHARNLTGWFPKTVKPLRPGWYQVKYAGIEGMPMRWFDGRDWMQGPKEDDSMCFFGMIGCRDKWRGLKEQAC